MKLPWRGQPGSSRVDAASVAFATLVLVGAMLARAWVSDDAFLTLRTVDQFLHGNGLVWNAGFRVQVYTHPAWMFLLTLPHAITGEPYFGTLALQLVIDVGVSVLLFRGLPNVQARAVALVALVGSQGFVDFGTSGLENPLSHLLVLLANREIARPRPDANRVFAPLGILAITRHDLVLLVLPTIALGLLTLRGSPTRDRVRAIALLGAPLALFTAFSIVYYGVPFPNTAYAKLGGGLERAQLVRNGLAYLLSSLVYDSTTILGLVLGVVLGLTSRRPRHRAFAIGVTLYVGYVVFVGGDFMRGRFLTAPLLVAVTVIADHAAALEPRVGFAWAATLGLLAALVFANRPELGDVPVDPRGIADERAFWGGGGTGIEFVSAGAEMPTHPHVAQGRAAARARRSGAETLVRANTGGMLGYYAGRDAYVLEWYGLSDPVMARLPAIRQIVTRPGHLLRFVDGEYLAMLEDASNGRPFRCRGEVRRCRLFEDALLATHADLLAPGRLEAIVRLSFRRVDWGDAHDRYRRPDMPILTPDVAGRPVDDGAAWNGPSAHRMPEVGALVRFPSPRSERSFTVALDANDAYRVVFRRSRRTLGTVEFGASSESGLVHRAGTVPEAARGRFDEILLEPSGGDGRYAFAHLRLH